MKILNIKTTTYDVGDGFRVDIVQDGKHFDAYIFHQDYGIKTHMFGVATGTVDEFVSLVEGSLEEDKAIYEEDYMNDYML